MTEQDGSTTLVVESLLQVIARKAQNKWSKDIDNSVVLAAV